MIIQDNLLKADGTIESIEVVVEDNYFDTLPEPMTTEEAILDKLTELEYRQDLSSLGLEGGAST